MSTQQAATVVEKEISANSSRHRLDSVDLLRGLVMVIMALDHVRDYFSNSVSLFDPTDLGKTTSGLFLTRWITHFCAPVFVFLAGTGAYLSLARGKSKRDLSWFLITRGVWLIFLEFTLVRFGWTFNFNYDFVVGQVIWVLGWSMIILAGLIHLPLWLLSAAGLLMIGTHNIFDGIKPESFGNLRWLWMLLHNQGGFEPVHAVRFQVIYPLIPWPGVMAVGYGFGALLQRETGARIRLLLKIGVTAVLAFIVLRAINIYGDPQPWTTQPDNLFTVWSFLNCQKYPPSLLYLLMTLGPAIIVLALFDWIGEAGARLTRPLLIFGRVPLFYYLIHITLIHALAIAAVVIKFRGQPPPFSGMMPPPSYGFELPWVYLAWFTVVLILYPLCRWFAGLKQRRKDPWLSYL